MLLDPCSFCNYRQLVLKPFLLQEVICGVLDYVCPFLFTYLVFRTWLVGLVALCSVFFSILWVEMILFKCVVMRRRKDYQPSWRTIFVFPFYRFVLRFFRLFALLFNVIDFSLPTKNKTIEAREDEGNIPPCPDPSTDVDWYTVWHVDDTADKIDKIDKHVTIDTHDTADKHDAIVKQDTMVTMV